MTESEERYVHLVECCESLNEAWRILQELRSVEKKGIIYAAAFRFALVAYCRPYNRSDGEHKKKRDGYLLVPPSLSPKDLSLHSRIKDLRNKALAHSDLTLKDAMVSIWRFDDRASICIARNLPGPLPELEAVIGLIERTLTLLYREKAEMLEAIAPKA